MIEICFLLFHVLLLPRCEIIQLMALGMRVLQLTQRFFKFLGQWQICNEFFLQFLSWLNIEYSLILLATVYLVMALLWSLQTLVCFLRWVGQFEFVFVNSLVVTILNWTCILLMEYFRLKIDAFQLCLIITRTMVRWLFERGLWLRFQLFFHLKVRISNNWGGFYNACWLVKQICLEFIVDGVEESLQLFSTFGHYQININLLS